MENLFRRVYKNIFNVQSTLVTLFIGDIIGYLEETGKSGIYEKVAPVLKELEPLPGEKEAPLTIISHSLGTVIASNYVYDKVSEQKKRGFKRMDPRFVLMNFFTAGSPIALFSMKFGGPEHFDRPIAVEDSNGRWINFLDKDDPVAMPLRPLNAAHAHSVHNDYLVETGWLAVAHTDYFKKPDTLNLIARKLAIDWIRVNERADEAALQKLQTEFDALASKRSLSFEA